MNDEKIWLETEDGQKLFIIKSEKIDMQEELNKTIEKLQQELQRKDNIINGIEQYFFGELQLYGGGGIAEENYNKIIEIEGKNE